MTISLDGTAEFRINSSIEAKLAVKGLKLLKRQIRIALNNVNSQMRDLRQQYTHYTRTRLPILPSLPFGKNGAFMSQLAKGVRLWQHAHRFDNRSQLAADLAPLYQQKQYLDQLVNRVEQHIIQVETFMHQNGM